MYYDPEESWNPSSWLGTFANELHNDYLNYWEFQNVPPDSELTDEDRARFQQLREIGDAVVLSLHTLTAGSPVVEKVRAFLSGLGATNEVDPDFAAKVARALFSHAIVRDGVKIDLAMQATDVLLAGAEERAAFLVGLIAHRSLSERAAAFLDRATRLYLWGFEPETVVMCAAVLEAAYESRFTSVDMFALQIQKKGKHFEPYQYEHAATVLGVFSPLEKEDARHLRESRNDAIHAIPAVALSPIDALRRTATLLDRLFPVARS